MELSKTQLKPFLMRIWGPPNGTENEAGNLMADELDIKGEGKSYHQITGLEDLV